MLAVGLACELVASVGDKRRIHLAAVAIHIVAVGRGGGGIVEHGGYEEVAGRSCLPVFAIVGVDVALAVERAAVGDAHKILIGAILKAHGEHHFGAGRNFVAAVEGHMLPCVFGPAGEVYTLVAHELRVFIDLHPYGRHVAILEIVDAVDRFARVSLEIGSRKLAAGVKHHRASWRLLLAVHAVIVLAIVPL